MAPPPGRIVADGTRWLLDGQPWRGAGFNCHWLGLRETVATSANPYPTHAMIDKVLDDAAALGPHTVVRAHTLGISAGLAGSLVTGINPDGSLVWNLAAWEPIDYAIAGARARGVKLSIAFTDIHDFYHRGRGWWVSQAFLRRATSGIPSTYTYGPQGSQTTETGVISYTPPANAGFSGTARAKAITQQFYRLPWLRSSFNAYCVAWLQHVNPLTGVANADETAVAFVSPGNEMWDSGDEYPDHAGADGIAWLDEWVTAVKQVAPWTPIVDPQGADGANPAHAPGRDNPDVAALDYHLYNNHQAYAAGYVEGIAATINSFGKVAVGQEYSTRRSGYPTLLAGMEQTAGFGFGLWWAMYVPEEGHNPGSVDDTVEYAGQASTWRTAFQSHSAVMAAGDPPAAPPPPVNLLRSRAAATSETTAAAYDTGSTDAAAPALTVDATAGVSGAGLRAVVSGAGHKWIFVDLDPAAAAPVTAGQTYTATVHARLVSGGLGSGWYGHITWLKADGSYLSGVTAAATVTASQAWVQVTHTAVAPAGAAYAVPQMEFDGPTSGTATIALDQWGVAAGSTATPWVAPVESGARIRLSRLRIGGVDGTRIRLGRLRITSAAGPAPTGNRIRLGRLRLTSGAVPAGQSRIRVSRLRALATRRGPGCGFWSGGVLTPVSAALWVGGRLIDITSPSDVDLPPITVPAVGLETDTETDTE